MRKIFLLFIPFFLFLLAPHSEAYYEFTKRVTVKDINYATRNMVIQRPDENFMWLLRYKGNHNWIKEGSRIILIIRDILDGRKDYIKINYRTTSEITQAEKINEILTVNYVYPSNTKAEVIDDEGNRFDIHYGEACKHMPPADSKVYLYRFGRNVAIGDLLYLPRNLGTCPLSYVGVSKNQESAVSVGEASETLEQVGVMEDNTRPTVVRDVRAIRGNKRVYLKWDPARDNVEIDHYIVSTSKYSINTDEVEPKDMPNQIKTSKTSLTVLGLENFERYYFYVLAVDTSGNMSSQWSREISATPTTSIPAGIPAPTNTFLNLRKTHETPSYYIFRWSKLSTEERQQIILTAGNKEVINDESYDIHYLKVNKTTDLQEEPLKLTVRVFDRKGQMSEQNITFQFNSDSSFYY